MLVRVLRAARAYRVRVPGRSSASSCSCAGGGDLVQRQGGANREELVRAATGTGHRVVPCCAQDSARFHPDLLGLGAAYVEFDAIVGHRDRRDLHDASTTFASSALLLRAGASASAVGRRAPRLFSSIQPLRRSCPRRPSWTAVPATDLRLSW